MQKSITQLGDQFNRKAQAKELNDHLNSVKQKIENKAAKQKETSQSININGCTG